MNTTAAARDLRARKVDFHLFRHPGPVRSLEQAAAERGQAPGQVVRSILFRLAEGEYVLVLIAGPGQIFWRALRAYLGRSRLTMATEAEVKTVTGYELGAVTPFGLPQPLRVLIDQSVTGRTGEVSIGSGERGLAVILQAQDLVRALPEAEHGNFTA